METKITRTWETPSGIKVEVKGELVTEKRVNLDGQHDTVPACDIKLNVYANGKSQGSWIKELTSGQRTQLPKQCTHCVGSLPLTSEHVEIIREVKAQLEEHPVWVAKQEKIAAEIAAIADYENTLDEIDRQEGV